MRIEDLTKRELLELIIIRGLNFYITDRDMQTVRWNTMNRKAKETMDESMVEMNANRGPTNWPAYKKASDKFERAQKLYDEAEKFINESKD